MDKLFIVIPVYNEAENIRECLNRIKSEVKIPYVIGIVYDREGDTTLPVVTQMLQTDSSLPAVLIKNKYGRGALNAIKTGLENSTEKYTVVTMADLSDPPSVINDMYEKAEKENADIVCASRYMKGGSQKGGPFIKGLMSRMAGISLHLLARVPTYDSTNSFKLYRTSFLQKQKIESSGGFELGLELVAKAHVQKAKIAEVPTIWTDRSAGKSNFKVAAWTPKYLKWYFYAFKGLFAADRKIYLFDMDGTLTPARLPMTEEFAVWFRKFISENQVFIVSGSDIEKIKSQMPRDIFENVSGIYASMGNEFYKKGECLYIKDFNPPKELLILLEQYRRNTKYTGTLFPNYIEYRRGMINFSVLGRDCPYEERTKYKAWDDKNGERAAIQKELNGKFKELDISIGGNISMDIVPEGFGKEQVAERLRGDFPNAKIIFTGDRTKEGGNDYSLARALLKLGNAEIVQVENPQEVIDKVKS